MVLLRPDGGKEEGGDDDDCLGLQGSSAECEKFETKISVCKYPNSDRHSISYNGKVCPIDLKGADDLDSVGCGLNVRDACMEKIFLVESSTVEGEVEGGPDSINLVEGDSRGEPGQSTSSEKEEGEVGEAGEGERYKFWVKVNLFRVTD